MRQKLAKFQALKSTLQCTVYVHSYICIYMHIYSCVHTHANMLCVFLLFCFDHIWQRAERSTLSLSTHKHSTRTHSQLQQQKQQQQQRALIHSLTHALAVSVWCCCCDWWAFASNNINQQQQQYNILQLLLNVINKFLNLILFIINAIK